MPQDPRQIFRDTNAQITAMVDKFVSEVESRLEAAQLIVAHKLGQSVTESGGKLVMDAKTQRAIRGIDKLVDQAMDELHYPELVDAFVAQFGRVGFQSFNEILKSAEIGPVRVTKIQQTVFASQQATIADNLEGLVKNAAELVKRRASFSLGAVSLRDLTTAIASALKTSFAQARTLADTSITKFLRNIHATGYSQIEGTGTELKYRYIGPIDALVSHKLCIRLVAHPEALYTRAEIEAMKGDLPDVFLSGGGWNCRHWWVVGAINGRVLMAAA